MVVLDMATGRSTKLTGAIGEFLVAAELCRLGLIATPFSGNVPDYDIIAIGKSGGLVPVQVKAINGTTWQFDIRSFIDVQMADDGIHQVPEKLKPEPFKGLICVLVLIKETGRDRFFILQWKELRNILARAYKGYLIDHDFKRPRAHNSFHTALAIKTVEKFEDIWDNVRPV